MNAQLPQLYGLGASPTVPTTAPSVPSLAIPSPWPGTAAETSWNQIQSQIQAEGQAAGATASTIQGNLAQAQSVYLSKLQSLVTNNVDPNLSTMANAAQTATLATTTVLGAVQSVQGIAQGITSGNPQEVIAGVQSLVGTIVSIAVGAGLTTAGVGAAVSAAIGVLLVVGYELLSAAGLLGGAPPGSVQVGDQACSGQGFTSPGQASVGGVIAVPGLTQGLVSPGSNGEGVCVAGALVSPGSPNWRFFPDPNTAADAAWFTVPSTAGGYVSWQWPPGAAQAGWTTANNGAWRPIDNAFHYYRQLECEASLSYALANGGGPSVSTASLSGDQATGVPAFLAAFFHMWKQNAAFALNGLTPAPDTVVLQQLVAAWNTAHETGTTFTFSPAPSTGPQGQGQGTDCNAVTGGYSYVSILVAQMQNQDASTSGLTNGALVINTGALKTPPNTLAGTSPVALLPGTAAKIGTPAASAASSTSTAATLATGAAVVAGTALAGTALYAYATKQSFSGLLASAWKKVRGAL